jgi:hypothetical protein
MILKKIGKIFYWKKILKPSLLPNEYLDLDKGITSEFSLKSQRLIIAQ